MKCITCKYFVTKDDISLMSQLMGYTAECSKTGILFTLEKMTEEPPWCPLLKDNNKTNKITEKP